MISHPECILYTCIASGMTVLAEFNSRDAELASLVLKCLEKTPPHHLTFTHTVNNRSYTFLTDKKLVYFAIYDKKLEYPEAITYLKSVRDAFQVILVKSDTSSLNPHCFQGEFNSVFHQLLASNLDFGSPVSPRGRMIKGADLGLGREEKRFGAMSPTSLKKKKKKRFGDGDSREELFENKLDLSDRDFPRNVALYDSSSSGFSFKAKRVWKTHVWIVLTLDLVLCLGLFCVWLWICRGLKCINS